MTIQTPIARQGKIRADAEVELRDTMINEWEFPGVVALYTAEIGDYREDSHPDDRCGGSKRRDVCATTVGLRFYPGAREMTAADAASFFGEDFMSAVQMAVQSEAEDWFAE